MNMYKNMYKNFALVFFLSFFSSSSFIRLQSMNADQNDLQVAVTRMTQTLDTFHVDRTITKKFLFKLFGFGLTAQKVLETAETIKQQWSKEQINTFITKIINAEKLSKEQVNELIKNITTPEQLDKTETVVSIKNNKRKINVIQPTQEVKIPVNQLDSINQITYEKSKNNVIEGKYLCGLFATYNGLKMLEAIQKGQVPVFCKSIDQEIEHFNAWLMNVEVNQAILANKERNRKEKNTARVTYFNESEIGDLVMSLMHTNDDISVIGSNTFDIRKTKPNMLGDSVFTNINRFRQAGHPQLILWVCGGHWIPIILTTTEIWVMDSWENTSQKDSLKVAAVSDFFRSEKIPTPEERKILAHQTSELRQKKAQAQGQQNITINLIDSDDDNDPEVQVVLQEDILITQELSVRKQKTTGTKLNIT